MSDEADLFPAPRKLSRREMIGVSSAALVTGGALLGVRHWTRREQGLDAEVAVLPALHYDANLTWTILDGFAALRLTRREIQGRRVLLKPNLVETAVGEAHINTNPMMVVAAAEAFRRLGAADVIVAEGQGHRRDSQLVLHESGMGEALRSERLRFVDLNHDDIVKVPNRGTATELSYLYLPKTLLEADLVVSMPKVKTHHWAGVTCAMKNLFGVMPGTVYGWPKNVLHHHGIPESIFDINATVRPSLAIVDGVVGMEGDGPIMGTPKQLGCVVIGRNCAAVDATSTRLMGLDPNGVEYLQYASGRLGPIHEENIMQRGESVDRMKRRFRVLELPHLEQLTRM